MANLSKLLDLSEQLEAKDRAAIVALIDLKTEGDMQAVLNKLDVMSTQLNAEIKSLRSHVDALESNMDTKIGALEKAIGNIKWFIGVAVALGVAASRLLAV